MSRTSSTGRPSQILGRYVLFGELASGGMATVHLGRLLGPAGFTKTVAIKRLHAQFAKEPEFVSMFLDEARLVGRIQHPNVVSTLDVVQLQGEVYVVMDYVEGEALSRLLKACAERNDTVDPKLAASILCAALQGLHAAHESNDERGRPLGIVHRDVSPQNVLVGRDGIARVLDFGVAKARGRLQSSREGQLKGKLSYMAPEQVHGRAIDRRTDIYAASVMLWEVLTGKRLVSGDNEAAIIASVVKGEFSPPSQTAPWVPPALDAIVMRGLEQDPARRFQTAREMAIELDRAVEGAASAYGVGEWVERLAGDALKLRATRVREMESSSAVRQIEAQRNLAPPLPTSAVTDVAVPPPPIGSAAAPPLVLPASGSITPPPGDQSYPLVDARPTMPVPPPDPGALAAADFISFENTDEPLAVPAVPAGIGASPLPEFSARVSLSEAPTAQFQLPVSEGDASDTHATPETAPTPRRRNLFVGLALVVVVVASGLYMVFGAGDTAQQPRIAQPAPKSASTPKPTAEAKKPPRVAPTPPEPVAPGGTVATPETGAAAPPEGSAPPSEAIAAPEGVPRPATDAPSPQPTMTRKAGAKAARTVPAPLPGSPKRKARCNPPFYVDSEGVKHIKPECL
jgi:serine/threonine-protein kinase